MGYFWHHQWSSIISRYLAFVPTKFVTHVKTVTKHVIFHLTDFKFDTCETFMGKSYHRIYKDILPNLVFPEIFDMTILKKSTSKWPVTLKNRSRSLKLGQWCKFTWVIILAKFHWNQRKSRWERKNTDENNDLHLCDRWRSTRMLQLSQGQLRIFTYYVIL